MFYAHWYVCFSGFSAAKFTISYEVDMIIGYAFFLKDLTSDGLDHSGLFHDMDHFLFEPVFEKRKRQHKVHLLGQTAARLVV